MQALEVRRSMTAVDIPPKGPYVWGTVDGRIGLHGSRGDEYRSDTLPRFPPTWDVERDEVAELAE